MAGDAGPVLLPHRGLLVSSSNCAALLGLVHRQCGGELAQPFDIAVGHRGGKPVVVVFDLAVDRLGAGTTTSRVAGRTGRHW
jgi:hypothetical protein